MRSLTMLVMSFHKLCASISPASSNEICKGLLWDFKVVDGSASIRQAWNKAWDVNVTGAHVMTHNFVPLLLASSDPRIVFITSSGATMSGTENTELPVNSSPSSGWPKTMPRTYVPSYRSSKMGLNMMMRYVTEICKSFNGIEPETKKKKN